MMKGWSDCYMAKSTRFRSLHSNSRGLMTFSGFNRNFMHMKHINVSKTPTHEKQKHINIFFKKRKKMMMNLISRSHKIGVVILSQIEIILKCCLQESHIEHPAPSCLQFEWLNVSVFFKLACVVMRANVIIGLVFRAFQNWWMKVHKIAIIPFNANKFVIKVQDWIYSTQET